MLWVRSEEHTSELQSPDTISYAVFCLKKKKTYSCFSQPSTSKSTSSGALSQILTFIFFFNDTATTEIYTVSDTLSLHDALPICRARSSAASVRTGRNEP